MTTRRRRLIGALLTGTAFVVSALLVALAADLLQWEQSVRQADGRFVASGDTTVSWEAEPLLLGGVSGTLLGVDDDTEFREAVRRFWVSKPRNEVREFADVTRRSAAERYLSQVGSGQTRERQAIAANLRGALLLEEARNAPAQRSIFIRRAIDQYRRAVLLDPGFEDALYNLELAMKLLKRLGDEQGGGGAGRGSNENSGSGAASSGRGF